MRGRPRKPSALRALEGNRSRTDIPPEPPLHGTPELPGHLDSAAAEHFTFMAAEFGGAGVLKRADGPALAVLADLWSKYWRASDAYDKADDSDERDHWWPKVKDARAAWEKQASKLGIQVIDRSRLIIKGAEKEDPVEDRFFKVMG